MPMQTTECSRFNDIVTNGQWPSEEVLEASEAEAAQRRAMEQLTNAVVDGIDG